MGLVGKACGLFAVEIVLLVTPLMFPTIPSWLGYASYAAASLLAFFSVGSWLWSRRASRKSVRSPLAIEFAGIDGATTQPGGFRDIVSLYCALGSKEHAEAHALLQVVYLGIRNNGASTVSGITVTVEEIGFGTPPSVNRQRRPHATSSFDQLASRFRLPTKSWKAFEASVRPEDMELFELLRITEIGYRECIITGMPESVDQTTMERHKEAARLGALIGGRRNTNIPRNDGVEIAVSVHGDNVPPIFGRFYLDLRWPLRARYREVASLKHQGTATALAPRDS